MVKIARRARYGKAFVGAGGRGPCLRHFDTCGESVSAYRRTDISKAVLNTAVPIPKAEKPI